MNDNDNISIYIYIYKTVYYKPRILRIQMYAPIPEKWRFAKNARLEDSNRQHLYK